jgi:hypothetical protein
MTDQWSETLRCRRCRNIGMARLSQFNGADVPTVDSITGNFKVVPTGYGPDFHCVACDLQAVP